MNIPIKIYSYAIIIFILIILAISVYLYLLPTTNSLEKTFIIWFTIILEINLIHLYYILNFYNSNINKTGIKGPIGDIGSRGFKGFSEKCISCRGAGKNEVIYGGQINDKGELDTQSKAGKCQYPFVHNYKYEYDGCINYDPPPGQDENNATIHGWCATETNDKNEIKSYGYCNENESIKDKMAKEKAYGVARNNYINNNYGILDVDVVHGNSENEAIEKCDAKGSQYSILKNSDGGNQDLNEGIGGKFLYLCSKTGFGSLGVNKLELSNDKGEHADDNNYKIIGKDDDGSDGIDLNLDSVELSKPLYMFKNIQTSEDPISFIKDLKIFKGTEFDNCEKAFGEKWNKIGNLNDVNGLDTPTDTVDIEKRLTLCENREATLDKIDNAFTYKGKLYIFRGDKFYKMTKEPIQSVVKSEEGYPKHISERWFSGDDCSRHSKTDCNKHIKCHWNSEADASSISNPEGKGECESITYDAAFTYGHDNKTYFFNGGNVFKYNDKQMKIEDGYPKPIKEVFKGVPTNIDAVFTWPKDGKTYFFKGKEFYKYNDKKQEIESGYPRLTKNRWKRFPEQINAIFTLDISLDNGKDTHPTYVIDSIGQSYYIDPITDELKTENTKSLDERFKMFDIEKENSATTTSS